MPITIGCGKNWNNIDLLLSCEYDFRSAVAQLEAWLEQYRSTRSKSRTTAPKSPPESGA